MSYIVEYTTLSGKRIPIPHKIFETAESAEAYGSQGVEQGNYKAYTVVETETNEGHKILPPMDKEKYQPRSGLEGPFSTLSGKVVYYDPKAGKYYDPDTDMYMSYDEFRRYDDDYKGMKDERNEVKEAKLSPEQREELDDLIDMVKYGTSPSTYDDDARDAAMQALKTIRSKFGDKVADQVEDGIHDFHFPKHGMHLGAYGIDRLASKKPTAIKKDGKIDSRSAKSTKRDIKSNLRSMGKKDPKRLGESVEALKQIVADKSAAKVHGVMVDMFTASAIMQVYDAVSDKNKASMEQMLNSKAGLMKMADFAMKQINEWGGDDQYEAVERAIDSAGDWFYSKLQKGEDQLRARMEVHAGLKADLDDLGAGEEERNQAHKELEQVLIDTMNQFDKGMAEGCSPHKKGSAKYKKHMAAKHAAMGESESVTEGVADEAAHMERDHEVQMARSDLYKIANYAVKLHKMLKTVSEEQGIQGWMQAKITKAADYMSSVAHTLEYDMMEKHQSEPMPAAENVEEGKTASQHRLQMVNKIKKSGAVKSGSMSKDDKKVNETTTAGGIATAPMPMGKMIKRKKK